MIVPLSFTITLVAGEPPRNTVANGEKPLPIIVTDVAPVAGPEAGDMDDTEGVGLVDVSKNSAMSPAVAAAPGKLVNPSASAAVFSAF